MDLLHKMKEGYWIPDMQKIRDSMQELSKLGYPADSEKNLAIIEKYEGIILVDFVPTSENLAAWLMLIAQEKMKDLPNVRVKAIEYNETPKSHVRVER